MNKYTCIYRHVPEVDYRERNMKGGNIYMDTYLLMCIDIYKCQDEYFYLYIRIYIIFI
jgi:hypothetical protein